MKVRTLKEHRNDYGREAGVPYEKAVGRVYEIPYDHEAQIVIDAGLVENASHKK
jgi:hypothetical protein